MKNGLALKLISAFALLSLLPLLFTGIVAVYGLRIAHEQDVSAMEESLLKQKQEEIQKFFNDIVGLFELRVSYEQNSEISDTDQKFLLDKLLQENKFIAEAAFINLNGIETSKISRNQNANLMGLNDIKDLSKFKEAASGNNYFGPVYQTELGPMTTISSPVLNKSGQIIMVLSGEVLLTPLKNQLSSAQIGNLGYIYVIDKNGKILTGGKNIPVGHNISDYPLVNDSFRSNRYFTLEARSGILSSDTLSMVAPVKNLDWKLIVEWPSKDANSTIADLKHQYLIFSAAVLILVILIGGIMGASILVPLSKLSAGAQKFGKKDLDYRIKIETGDEIEELGTVMNSMAENLKKQMKEIEAAHKKIEDGLMEINKLKDDFIFVAAHELRSPVTVLQGYIAEILEDTKTLELLAKKNPYFVDMVKGIEVSKDRLSALVDDLLNIARMEAGKFKINIRENVDLNESVKPLVESMKELCKPKKITLTFETKGKIPPLKFDPDRANELLTNLISNAVKYNKDKGEIFVSAKFKDGMIEFEVKDTGIGLDEEEQKHLFEKFWRSEEVSKLQGTGLGLFIVKHMIEQMGGTISFNSKKGVGTSFTFKLPAA
jgi:signal transduction histidine kinase